MMEKDSDRYMETMRMIQRLGKDLIVIRDRDLAEIGVTSVQSTAILFIGSNPGCRIIDLGIHMGISHQAARALVERMCSKGFMTMEVCEDDARARTLHLTEQGLGMETRLRRKGGSTGLMVLDGFDEDELSTLESMLSRIRGNISK